MALFLHTLLHPRNLGLALVAQGTDLVLLLLGFRALRVVAAELLNLFFQLRNLFIALLHVSVEFSESSAATSCSVELLSV